ncbi:flagellar biosynthesis anti-sigma factor FlgM [Cytobacillus sp. IB215665]|uniref:flagellar biosynthesis anti-sigma factor FlgM n=1 Tax=Cytobacillus sp. IB215665 TaxID=3097357 RepID=UPI002A0F660F|nr:flagellar biosynthesis anti-sigma factor FlgM [Cytobacillus sp. IB215665]MDX8363818.1 flagellar biosynthesis anti-sigma factor FlgM [Cytobacillus sp. IB215665]
MKINQFGVSGINPYKQQLNKLDTIKKNNTMKDKLEISSAAKELQETTDIEAARQEKVEAIKQQVDSGTYTINREAVARGIYDFYSKK